MKKIILLCVLCVFVVTSGCYFGQQLKESDVKKAVHDALIENNPQVQADVAKVLRDTRLIGQIMMFMPAQILGAREITATAITAISGTLIADLTNDYRLPDNHTSSGGGESTPSDSPLTYQLWNLFKWFFCICVISTWLTCHLAGLKIQEPPKVLISVFVVALETVIYLIVFRNTRWWQDIALVAALSWGFQALVYIFAKKKKYIEFLGRKVKI